jgi:hypothetical protein
MEITTIRTLAIDLDNVPRYALDKIVCELSGRAAKLWAWLRGNADGWRFALDDIAARCRFSVRTAWRAAGDLVAAGLLELDGETWRVTAPASVTNGTAQSDASVTSGTYRQGRADARPRSNPRKVENLPTEQRSKRSRQSAIAMAGMSGDADRSGDTAAESSTAPSAEPPNRRDRPEPVKARPTNAPDNHGREAIPIADRVDPKRFLDAWRREFADGPTGRNLVTLPSAWQNRVLWIWQYWSRDELAEAYKATIEATPRKAWRYFCALLDAMASNRWQGRDVGAGGPGVRPGPVIDDDLRDEMEAKSGPDVELVERIRNVARSRGLDPDNLTPEQRGECIAEALRQGSRANG